MFYYKHIIFIVLVNKIQLFILLYKYLLLYCYVKMYINNFNSILVLVLSETLIFCRFVMAITNKLYYTSNGVIDRQFSYTNACKTILESSGI